MYERHGTFLVALPRPSSKGRTDDRCGCEVDPDIALALDDKLRAEGCTVEVASRVRLAASASPAGLDAVYEPEGPWFPTGASLASLACAPDRCRSVIVRSVMPAEDADALVQRFEAQGFESKAALADVTARLECCFSFQAGAAVHRDPLDCLTTSHDPASGRRIGLHIDAWTDEDRPSAAHEVFHLDLNLGPDDRYFLFMPLSAERLAALLENDAVAERPSARRLGQHFLAARPRTPVVRVRLRPGMAYLAPVERLLHDGCSAGAQRGILRVAVEGDVRPRA